MAIITGALSAANQNEWIANIRKRTYYNEILTRMSARRMELIQMTPDGVLKNLRTLISTQKANADAHANRR